MHTLQEIRRCLDDLTTSAKNDIQPIIQLKNPEGGYFGVPRTVLSYIDYLGALYRGYNGERDRNGVRRIATSRKAEHFITEIMSQIDPVYRETGRLLYRMYRHGTVHLYRPNALRRQDGRMIAWISYKGPRQGLVSDGNRLNISAQHCIPIRLTDTEDRLPVSINCLYDDLLASIERYYLLIENEINSGQGSNLQQNFSNVVDALMEPDETNLTWGTNG